MEAIARVMANGGESGLDGLGVEYYTGQLYAYILFQVILGNHMVSLHIP